jgi:uncharacterized protein (TIGR00645 family)
MKEAMPGRRPWRAAADSIVAISAIRLLEAFMNADKSTDHELAWLVGIHMAFVTSGLLLALMDRTAGRARH